MRQNAPTRLLFGVVTLLCLQHHTLGFAPAIPSPNVCKPSNQWVVLKDTWLSDDCPANALCVPTKQDDGNQTASEGRCSCSFTEDMFTENDEGKCVASRATKSYAIVWIVVVVLNVALFVSMAHYLKRAHTHKAIGQDMLTISYIFALLSVIVLAVGRSVRVVQLLWGPATASTIVLLQDLSTATTVLLALLVMCTMLVFALAVQKFVFASSRLVVVRSSALRRAIFFWTSVLLCVVLPMLVVVLVVGQFALMSSVLALAAIVGWSVHFRASVRALGFRRPSSVFVFGLRSDAMLATYEIMKQVLALSRTILLLLSVYSISSAVYVSLWYIGREQRSKTILGFAKTFPIVGMYCVLSVGFFCMQIFFARICEQRIRRDNLAPPPLSGSNSKESNISDFHFPN